MMQRYVFARHFLPSRQCLPLRLHFGHRHARGLSFALALLFSTPALAESGHQLDAVFTQSAATAPSEDAAAIAPTAAADELDWAEGVLADGRQGEATVAAPPAMRRSAGILFLGVGLICGIAAWMKRRAGQETDGETPTLRHLQSIRLGTKQQVALVEVGGRQLLLGVSESDVRLLGNIDANTFESEETEASWVPADLGGLPAAQAEAAPRVAAAPRSPSADSAAWNTAFDDAMQNATVRDTAPSPALDASALAAEPVAAPAPAVAPEAPIAEAAPGEEADTAPVVSKPVAQGGLAARAAELLAKRAPAEPTHAEAAALARSCDISLEDAWFDQEPRDTTEDDALAAEPVRAPRTQRLFSNTPVASEGFDDPAYPPPRRFARVSGDSAAPITRPAPSAPAGLGRAPRGVHKSLERDGIVRGLESLRSRTSAR